MQAQLEKKLQKYVPKVFKAETLKKDNFLKLFAQMQTRTFGWGDKDSIFMAPMADNLNHHNVEMDNHIINTSMHLSADPESQYFSEAKYTCDYSPIFD